MWGEGLGTRPGVSVCHSYRISVPAPPHCVYICVVYCVYVSQVMGIHIIILWPHRTKNYEDVLENLQVKITLFTYSTRTYLPLLHMHVRIYYSTLSWSLSRQCFVGVPLLHIVSNTIVLENPTRVSQMTHDEVRVLYNVYGLLSPFIHALIGP